MSLFLVLVSIYSIFEVFDELQNLATNSESLWHVSVEVVFVIASLIALLYFTYIIHQQNQSHAKLEESLSKVRQSLEGTNIRLQKGKKEYLKVIQWQFNEWLLTPSEEEVTLLLLKGLSVKKIAKGRSTQEKTVRKQASAIYEKSGLAGRYELSAWFFEDML